MFLISRKMSERVGKIGLNACTPWSLFAENTAFEDSEGTVALLLPCFWCRPLCVSNHDGAVSWKYVC